MNIQYISDRKGKRTGVYIPIKEWEKITKRYDLPVEEEEPELTKDQLVSNIREALEEVKLAKEGKVKLKSARELLNEL
ncbi:hypothetical protein [Spirosoma litoris]